MITKKQRKNAERIKALADAFGHLPFNQHGQTVNELANLTIPCAILVCADIVTGVRAEDNDGLTDSAVEDVERLCRIAVDRTAKDSWPHDWAVRLNLPPSKAQA